MALVAAWLAAWFSTGCVVAANTTVRGFMNKQLSKLLYVLGRFAVVRNTLASRCSIPTNVRFRLRYHFRRATCAVVCKAKRELARLAHNKSWNVNSSCCHAFQISARRIRMCRVLSFGMAPACSTICAKDSALCKHVEYALGDCLDLAYRSNIAWTEGGDVAKTKIRRCPNRFHRKCGCVLDAFAFVAFTGRP